MSAPLLFQPIPYAVYGFPNARRLVSVASPWQQIEIWDTPQLGRPFTLDGRPPTSVGDALDPVALSRDKIATRLAARQIDDLVWYDADARAGLFSASRAVRDKLSQFLKPLR